MLKNKRRLLEIESIPGNINLVEKFVDQICDEYNISNTFFGNILISVTEAVKNAIYYGNNLDPEKKVKVKFEAHNAYLSFTVSDEGKGLDFRNLDNNENNYDTGLYLIQKLSDIMKFYNNGSRIEMIFHISSINRELSTKRLNRVSEYFSGKQEAKI